VPRFIIYGAGAVGGAIGARLHERGGEVALIARGPHREAIARDGLRFESAGGVAVHRIDVAEDPAELSPRDDDVVLLTVKSQDTVAALERLAAAGGAGLAVACAQNGVANERAALRRFARTYSVCVMLPATHLVPGVVVAHSAPLTGSLDVGRHPRGVDDTAETIAAALSDAGFASRARPDISRWKYSKLLRNVSNSVRALLGPAPAGRELLRRADAEAVAVLDAAGIDYVPDDEYDAYHASVVNVQPGSPTLGSSWQSLARGRPTIEAEYLNGEIVLEGRLHGVPTPVNELLTVMATEAARDGIAAGSLTEEDVLARLDGGSGD
jgi:2-dehydropantoate 2-reductase